MIEIRLLGQFNIQLDADPIKLPSRQAQSLLAFLLLNQGLQFRREKLAGVLWPDVDDEKSRRRLRYAIWQIRKSLGDEFLRSDKITISINSKTEFWLDISDIDRKDAHRLSTDELLQFVSLYKGELLPGFYEDWVELERERLLTSFENKLDLLLKRLLDDQRWSDVLEWGEKWISFGSSPEPAFRAVMIAHSEMGDISRALLAYERCQNSLEFHLGVEPSQETSGIYELIAKKKKVKSEKPTTVMEPATTSAPLMNEAFTFRESWQFSNDLRKPFFVRENELTVLDQLLHRTITGDGRVIFIRGDAGQGKTTLMEEFCKQALVQHNEIIISLGSCEARTGIGDPYLPFRDVLGILMGDFENIWTRNVLTMQGAQRIWELFPQSIQILIKNGPDLIESFLSGDQLNHRYSHYFHQDSRWLDELEHLISIRKNKPAPINIPHSDIQKDLFEQYTKVILGLANHKPLLICLDDLQWADLGSISLLFHLGRRIEGKPIMILGAYRPSEVARINAERPHPLLQVVAELIRKYGEVEIDLDQMDENEGRRFVDSLLDQEPNNLDEDFRKAFYQHTSGHPLFSVELLHQMQNQGELYKDEQGRWVAGSILGWDKLPARVEAVIGGRINSLPEDLKRILNVASVEGMDFSAEIIAMILGVDPAVVIHQLSQELDKRYFLVEALGAQRLGEQRLSKYRFRHHLFSNYTYNSLDNVERVHFHERVGKAMESLYNNDLDLAAIRLSNHYEEAGMTEKAIEYLLRAGEIAKHHNASESAVNHLRKGISLLDRLTDKESRRQQELELRISICAPLVAVGGYTSSEAELNYARARELCENLDDLTQLPTALWGLWSYYLVKADHFTARDIAKQIYNLPQRREDINVQIVANWTMGITHFHMGEFPQAQSDLNQVIELYKPEQHQDLTYSFGQNPAVTCMVYSSFTNWYLGNSNYALKWSQRSIDLAEEILHPYSFCFALSMAGILNALRRDSETTLIHTEKAYTMAREGGFPFLMALAMTTRAWARVHNSKQAKYIRQIRKGIDTLSGFGSNLGRPIFLSLLAHSHSFIGDHHEALKVVEEAIEAAHLNGEMVNLSDLYQHKGELLELIGMTITEAKIWYEKSNKIANTQGAIPPNLRI